MRSLANSGADDKTAQLPKAPAQSREKGELRYIGGRSMASALHGRRIRYNACHKGCVIRRDTGFAGKIPCGRNQRGNYKKLRSGYDETFAFYKEREAAPV